VFWIVFWKIHSKKELWKITAKKREFLFLMMIGIMECFY
jgi:hypothetical protein